MTVNKRKQTEEPSRALTRFELFRQAGGAVAPVVLGHQGEGEQLSAGQLCLRRRLVGLEGRDVAQVARGGHSVDRRPLCCRPVQHHRLVVARAADCEARWLAGSWRQTRTERFDAMDEQIAVTLNSAVSLVLQIVCEGPFK